MPKINIFHYGYDLKAKHWTRFFVLLFVFFHSFQLYSQYRGVGTWRYYANTYQYFELENINQNIYVNAHRMLFDVQTNPLEILKIDKFEGLSDFSISAMSYNDTSKRLIVTYNNTMMDVIDFRNGSKSISSNYDIYNKVIVGDKSILKIKFFKGKAYLCTKLGIVVFDYNKNEIESTFIIGDQGNSTPIHSLEIVGNQMIASIDRGFKVATIAPSINLQDYNNWTINTSASNDSFFHSSQIGASSFWMSKYTFYDYNSNLNLIDKDTLRVFRNMRKIGNDIYLIYDSLDNTKKKISNKIIKFDGAKFSPFLETTTFVNDLAINSSGEIFLSGNGFFKWNTGSAQGIAMNNYPLDFPYRLSLNGKNLYVSMGIMGRNLDANLNQTGYFKYTNNNWWERREIFWDDSLYDCTNEIAHIERDGGLYRAFVRGGVIFRKEGLPIIKYRKSNSKLEPEINVSTGEQAYRTSDMVMNPKDSSIWILSLSTSFPLLCLTKEGKWYSFDLSSVIQTKELFKIIIDQSGNKWILTRQDGLILFNEGDINNNSDNFIQQILEIKNSSKGNSHPCTLSIKNPTDAVVDKDNTLWVSSDRGVGSIYSCTDGTKYPCQFFIPAARIQNPKDTTVYYECVFLNTPVNALAVDAGNNLWLGTGDGLFYDQESLSSEYLRLNRLNSPFGANQIYDILVHPENGEVFVTTEVGLISYMGQSSAAEFNDELCPYRIIPNPVERDYNGLVTIDGLPDAAAYKITDVMGNLMYQGEANGSRVTWDMKTLHGVRVPSGVYYIFSGKPLLKGKTGVGKFTIIR